MPGLHGSDGSGPNRGHRVVLYTRPGCHLCDVAREAIASLQQRLGFVFDEIDQHYVKGLPKYSGFVTRGIAHSLETP